MIARIQQGLVLSLLLGALVWLASHWAHSPVVATAGALVILLGYSIFLAMQFIALRMVSDTGSTSPPAFSELLRAWIGEAAMAVQVFGWRQPFRAYAVPDQLAPANMLTGRRGVVFVHGFFCNRGFWTPWLHQVRGRGRAFAAVNLEPPFGSIDSYASLIDDAVRCVTEVTGMAPLIVCHSMGGLAVRAWLRSAGGDARVHHVVTIGTPHQGTWLGQFSPMLNGRQMNLSSDWLLELKRDGNNQHPVKWTCWYSNCDNIVFPASTAMLPGAGNRLVKGVAHVALAFHPEVMAASLAIIDGVEK